MVYTMTDGHLTVCLEPCMSDAGREFRVTSPLFPFVVERVEDGPGLLERSIATVEAAVHAARDRMADALGEG